MIFLGAAGTVQAGSQTYPSERNHKYSLEDFYALALERADQIKISEENLYIAQQGKDKARAALLPVLSAFWNYTRYSEREVSPSGFTTQPDSTISWGARLDQTLSLSGREFTAFAISGETVAKSRLDLNSFKEGYLLTVASAYYDVLKSAKALEIAQTNRDRLTKHRDAAAVRLRVGEATKTDLLRAEAELAGAQSELIRATNNYRLTKTVISRTVGLTGDYDIVKTESVPDPDSLIQGCAVTDLDCLKEIALSERDDMRALALQKKIAEDEVVYARGSYWPTVSAEGVYTRVENDPSSSFEIKERLYGGIKFNFPFFEGGLRRAEVREAKARQRQAELTYEDLKKTLFVDVENAYLDYVTQKGILESLDEQVIYATDNFNAVSKQFEHGLADSIDVVDANTLLVNAERERANALFDYHLSILKVKRATGTLLTTVLNQLARGT